LVGNLANRGWDNVAAAAWSRSPCFPVGAGPVPVDGTLQLGDEVAAGLGTPVQPVRLGLMLAGAGLVAFATHRPAPSPSSR